MPKIAYKEIRFARATRDIITKANQIIAEYEAQGFDLTLRQLYYQFVARGYLENKQSNYDRLGGIINDARLAGLVDWNSISDRTRNVRSLAHWNDPAHIVRACGQQFRFDLWDTQEYRPEVWIEKDALVGVIAGTCEQNDVPYFSCRGYTSQSEMWAAGQRFAQYHANEQKPLVIHLGDHDPSGIDMSRDIEDRLELLAEVSVEVRRIALNMPQVEQYNPPPNPAKQTDVRFADYQRKHGDSSWELDALSPALLAALILAELDDIRDENAWNERVDQQKAARRDLQKVADRWTAVVNWIKGG
jgi:hypothetical protein